LALAVERVVSADDKQPAPGVLRQAMGVPR